MPAAAFLSSTNYQLQKPGPLSLFRADFFTAAFNLTPLPYKTTPIPHSISSSLSFSSSPSLSMEAHKEAMAYSNSNSSAGESPSPVVVKRKRTKRHRAALQPPAAASSASSNELSGTTEVEEDMANCLILLAQGPGASERFSSRRFNEESTTAGGRVGFYVYECKTCSKCFPSFQALGGHRASHKKPKVTAASGRDSELLQIGMSSFSKPMASPESGGKPRTHECSICGSEFSSGQALGGHMRRHRPAVVSENSSELKKEKSVLSLDLNLPPAPIDDDILFSVHRKPLFFSPSAAVALLDCHY